MEQQRSTMRHKLVTLLVYTLIASTFVAACSSANPPAAGSSSNKCDAPAPARDNVRAQADNCGVSGLEIVRKDMLPKAPKVGIVTIDLYIEQHDVCAIVNVLCLLGDNRPFVSSGQPDPKADYSRNRAHMILDFRTGQLTLIVNPSCRIHPLGVGWDPNKKCFAPQNEGSGTDLKLNVASDGTVDIEVTLHQSDYPSGGSCDLYDHFSILPHNDAGTFDLTGEGSGFPDLAVIQGGKVVYADQGTHATELCFSPVHKRHYDYHPTATENPLGRVTEYLLPTSNSYPYAITAGPDGNLWFTELYGNKIGKITPGGTITEYPSPTALGHPLGITAGPDGNLWFTEHGNKIGKITPGGTITEYPISTALGYPVGITAGPDGNLWFTEQNGNKIGRIIP